MNWMTRENRQGAPRIKVCGLTDPIQARSVCEAGADAVGLVFAPKSPRFVSREDARQMIKKLPPFVQTVGVFVDESLEVIRDMVNFCGLDLVQLHGNEAPGFCKLLAPRVIKAFRVKDQGVLKEIENYQGKVRGILLDSWSGKSQGGTGKRFDWEIARRVVSSFTLPVILAGGLDCGNVREAVSRVHPWGLDVSSRVEISPGVKDMEKVKQFIFQAKSAPFSSSGPDG